MRFLLVYDVKGWAFHRWATGVVEHHGTAHEVKAVAGGDAMKELEKGNWDAVLHFSWYEAPTQGMPPNMAMVAHHGYQLPYTEDPFLKAADWRLLGATPFRNINNAAKQLPKFDGLLAANRLIEKDLIGLGHKDVFYAPGGVDHELFKPGPRIERPMMFIVGWCAQHDTDNPNNKGWRVLERVRQHFKNTDVHFSVINASHDNGPLKPDEMPNWYNSIDCLLVTSVSEGTPLTAQEAMSCGRPVIGTEVGILPELITNNHNGFLVDPCSNDTAAEYTCQQICDHIKRLKEDRRLCRAMGDNARMAILERWTWEDRAADYILALEAVANG